MTIEQLTLLVQISSALLVLIGLLYGSWQIKLLKLTHKENLEWNRRIETQKALTEYNLHQVAPDLNMAFNFINVERPHRIDDLRDGFSKDPKLQSQCHSLLNANEGFARGIRQGVFDDEIVRSARKTAMIRTYTAFKEYIDHRRLENNYSAYREFEDLVNRWRNEESKPEEKSPLGGA